MTGTPQNMFQVPPPQKILHPVLMMSTRNNPDSATTTLASHRSNGPQNDINNPLQEESTEQFEGMKKAANAIQLDRNRKDQQSQQLIENMAKLRELEEQKRDLQEVVDSYRKSQISEAILSIDVQQQNAVIKQ